VKFENSLEGQQDGKIVVDNQDTAFHVHLFPWKLSRGIDSFSIGVCLAST